MNGTGNKTEWLTVPQAVEDMGFRVSPDKVRQWCREGKIEGVVNVGDKGRDHFRIPRDGWERFKTNRRPLLPALPVSGLRGRSGVNHIGI